MNAIAKEDVVVCLNSKYNVNRYIKKGEKFEVFLKEPIRLIVENRLIDLESIKDKFILTYDIRYEAIQNREVILKELRSKYPTVKFVFYEEVSSLQLLHNCYELDSDKVFFDTVCDIALKYLTKEEQNIFCPLYDYLDQLKEVEI